MRELTYYVAVTLDGRIAGPDDEFDAIPVTGDHIDMVMRDWRDTLPRVGMEALGLEPDGRRFDAVLMGWQTYAAGLAWTDDPYPHLEQYVISRRHLQEPVPATVTVTDEDPVALVRRLKAVDGVGIWLCGGGVLADALVDEIDRLVLKVNPLVFGDGKPLFAGAYRPRPFILERSTPYGSGVVVNEYRRG